MKEKCKERYAEERRILKKAMVDKKLVVFVGSGTSIDSGMPSWGDAVRNIANKLNISEGNIDYMKIPQFYYNARGKKEYVELMRELFRYDDDLDICDVHRNIIKLSAHTMITTNYDCLLEKAAFENAEFLQVISQDKDLPYRTVEKELIKMHGDFSVGNFVLKEDDYLHYSDNFKLIEAYVKALIATNVVLFIGYSFSDPDIKQIFSWVKDILEDDFQRAYMLEVCNEYDFHEHEYYKNLGVNVIYASEMHENFNVKDASVYTNEFLKYILEEDSSEDQIDELFKRCQSYSDLNYICKKYINRIFRDCGIIITNNELMSAKDKSKETNELLSILFEDSYDDKNYKIGLINSIVSKSAVEAIIIDQKNSEKKNAFNRKIVKIEKKAISKLINIIETFDFEKLKNLREENEINLTDNTPELYLEQAYISYVLFEYSRAYRYLRISSNLFYKKKKYVWYFISEVNRKNVGKIIKGDFLGEYKISEKKKIMEEVDALELEIIYRKIPLKEADSREFLQDLYTFRTYYTLFQSTYLTSKKTEKEAKTKYSMYAGVPGYKKLREQIRDCYYYDLLNYIMVDRYQEDVEIYRLFAHTIINSACSTDLSVQGIEEDKTFNTGNIYVDCLEKFDVYIILRYMKQDELKYLLNDNCNKYIDISNDTKDYLQDIIKNISKIKKYQYQYFWTYLTLAGYIKLDLQLVEETMKAISSLLNEYNVRVHYNEIRRFIWWADKQKVFASEKSINILSQIIEKLISSINSTDREYWCRELLRQCLAIYKNIKEPYYSETLLLLARSMEYEILVNLYPFCNKNIQTEIETSLSGWKWENKYQQVSIYESLVLNDNLERNEKIEEDILDGLEELKKESRGIEPNLYEQVIGSITNLYLNDKICKKEEIKLAIKKSDNDVAKWLVEMDEYDYKSFHISWLDYCSEALLKTIALSPVVKKEISNKIREAYLNGNANKNMLKRYFEFFC